MTVESTHELAYQVRLDAPALLATLAGDPSTVVGDRHIAGSSLLGAFAGQWIRGHQLGQRAHEDETFAGLFLRGRLTFLNAYPEDLDGGGRRLLPVPLSFRRPKGNRLQVFDEATERHDDADTRVRGFCTLAGQQIQIHQPVTRLRLHTARADRLIGRPTAAEGSLFAYQALEGGQTFQGRLLGSKDDLTTLTSGLCWTRANPLSLALGRSRSAEYGGQARLRLLHEEPRLFSAEVPTEERQEPEQALVLTLTSPLIPYPNGGLGGRLRFPFADLAKALAAAGAGVDAAELEQHSRAFAASALIGGYSGIWGMPRQQVDAFAAGSVFTLTIDRRQLGSAELRSVERQALGQRVAEGFGRLVLNWHGATAAYHVREWAAKRAAAPPKLPAPETFRRVALDVARSWARDRVQAEARSAAQEVQRASGRVTPALLRRLAELLRALDERNAATLREQLTKLRSRAREQIQGCRFNSGQTFGERLALLCSPDVDARREPLRRLLGLNDPPGQLLDVLREARGSEMLESPEQLARLASLYIQVLCAELARLQRNAEGHHE